MAEFLHKKLNSSLWYYRRRYPKDVAKALGKTTFMQSLKTTVKREAEKLSRNVSVQFDLICHEARLECNLAMFAASVQKPLGGGSLDSSTSTDEVLAKIPALVRKAACRVIEEQQHNPKDWQSVVKRWQSFYGAMLTGEVPRDAQQPAIEAQAILNGIELAIQGKPVPSIPETESRAPAQAAALNAVNESWDSLCRRALALYQERVQVSRYQLALRRLPEIEVRSTEVLHVQAGLLEWCKSRLREVQPRTVKTQLDCLVSALRCVLPQLVAPQLRELKGVMQPSVNDRQSMPIHEIRAAIQAFKNKPAPAKVRADYGGGASQFDAIAVEALAVLGMRPRELIQATPRALVTKTDVFGERGQFFRLVDGKNKASERDIPLNDGTREVLPVERLREMLEWQEKNLRSPHGAVSSFGTRFREMTGGRTLYQMRHSWKDVAANAGIDAELRERLMGHKVAGIAAVYGSGIPLARGLDALLLIRNKILG